MPSYLISRWADIGLGFGTGILAFTLNETNPRSAPPAGYTLRELISWKVERSRPPKPPRRPTPAAGGEAEGLELPRELENVVKDVADGRKLA